MAAQPPVCNFGEKAHDFALPGTDGRIWRLADVAGQNGLLLVFMCNHCPYVRSIIDRLVRDARELQELGVGVAAICANDSDNYPQDGFEAMQAWAREKSFPFPYLHDGSQEVARRFGAVCTPDFFGYNAALELQYRGRLDESKTSLVPDARRDLFLAMKEVARTGQGPREQIPSMGCSIKWKAA
ncbi:MAG: thioredoxin family protein [Geminicoccaceae bacterium]|nr:thioredoxin family protein [Geminicoccaceae bacterium]